MRFIAIVALIITALYCYAYGCPWRGEIEHPPGVLVNIEPLQRSVASQSWKTGEFTLTTQNAYIIKARVLGASRYHMGVESEISPIDLALGWQTMSDSRTVDALDIWQRSRWYYFEGKEALATPLETMLSYSANTHMIPKNEAVKKQLFSLRTGQVVLLAGYLVNVTRADGWYWNTSLTRTDKAGGSCEIMWVESVELVNDHVSK